MIAMRTTALAVSLMAGAVLLRDTRALAQDTHVHEYPHAPVVLHYHPVSGVQFTLDEVRFALAREVHAIELDLHYRASDGQVVVNHDGATPESPTLAQVIDLVVEKKAGFATVHDDGYQFFLVLDVKQVSSLLFEGIVEVLGRYTEHLSTAVAPGDPPRGITAVITGEADELYAHFQTRREQLNRLGIVERHDYSAEIGNLSACAVPFQWVSVQHDGQRGRVNPLHSGTDGQLAGRYNLRIWDCDDDPVCLASGADDVNTDPDEVEGFEQLIASQKPRGFSPSLALRGSRALLTWRGEASTNLYVSVGTFAASGLSFPRQILLTHFLAETPMALAPAAALTVDGRLFVVYEGTDSHRLWYVSGRFTSPDRFLTFEGGERRLTLPGDAGRLGSHPAVAVAPDGRVIVVYEGTADQRLFYVSGYLNAEGELVGEEFSLTEGDARRGYTPSISIDAAGRVVVVYRGTDDLKLWYVSGLIDGAGRIVGEEFSLTEGDARRGFGPAVAFDQSGRVVVVYEGTDDQKLFYVSGVLDGAGRIIGPERSLTEGDNRRGSNPTVAFDDSDGIVILYEGTDANKLWYVHGHLDASGQVIGEERLLDMGLDRRPANQPPVCDAGGPYTVECAGAVTEVPLDGSGSSDAECSFLTFAWTGAFSEGAATGSMPAVHFPGTGVFPVTLAVSDGTATSTCSLSVAVRDTIAPSILAPPDVTAECVSPAGTSPDLGSPLTSDVCDASLQVTNDAPAGFPVGTTTVTWTARDASGNTSTAAQRVTIVDTRPPSLSVSVTPALLWPPSHQLVTINASISATDGCDPNPAVRLVSITSNEPDDAAGDGATPDDIQGAAFGTDDRAFQLRAERQGGGTGRVYTVTYQAQDAHGNVATAQATVRVPKSHPD